MMEGNDTQRVLGELLAGGLARQASLERIERHLENQAKEQTITRIMVEQDRAWIRGLRWLVAVLVASVGALGFDWWRR